MLTFTQFLVEKKYIAFSPNNCDQTIIKKKAKLHSCNYVDSGHGPHAEIVDAVGKPVCPVPRGDINKWTCKGIFDDIESHCPLR